MRRLVGCTFGCRFGRPGFARDGGDGPGVTPASDRGRGGLSCVDVGNGNGNGNGGRVGAPKRPRRSNPVPAGSARPNRRNHPFVRRVGFARLRRYRRAPTPFIGRRPRSKGLHSRPVPVPVPVPDHRHQEPASFETSDRGTPDRPRSSGPLPRPKGPDAGNVHQEAPPDVAHRPSTPRVEPGALAPARARIAALPVAPVPSEAVPSAAVPSASGAQRQRCPKPSAHAASRHPPTHEGRTRAPPDEPSSTCPRTDTWSFPPPASPVGEELVHRLLVRVRERVVPEVLRRDPRERVHRERRRRAARDSQVYTASTTVYAGYSCRTSNTRSRTSTTTPIPTLQRPHERAPVPFPLADPSARKLPEERQDRPGAALGDEVPAVLVDLGAHHAHYRTGWGPESRIVGSVAGHGLLQGRRD